MEILIYIACFISAFALIFFWVALAFFWNALIVLALCWGLNALGIFTIGTFVVQFSWPLVIVFTVVMSIIKSIFNITINKKD
jgi:hypothetical protein